MPNPDLSAGPFNERLGFSRTEKEAVQVALDAAGVRTWPFPFSSAIAVLSDCDAANSLRYAAYMDAFLRLGLDFGDSTWLHWTYNRVAQAADGLGFFSNTCSTGRKLSPEFLDQTRTFAESVGHYHLGNIDHFHSLLRFGPRAVVIDCRPPDGDSTVKLPALQTRGYWRVDGLSLFGLLIDGACEAVSAVTRNGGETSGFQRMAAPDGRRSLFALPFDPEAENSAPLMTKVRAVKLTGARGVKRVVLLSAHTRMLLDAVAWLRAFNVEMGLVTEHARQHFRSPVAGAIDDEKTRERLKAGEDPPAGVLGSISDDEGLIVSTDADDPASIDRVLPELFDLGLRFLVPMPAHGAAGLELLDVVSPTPTRAGGGAYYARRTMPLGKALGATRQETFAARLGEALAVAARAPGRCWPIYTHLGAITAEREYRRAAPVRFPYLEEGPMRALRDAAFGVSANGPRAWFTRGSVLYDYALIARSIAGHLRREGDDIHIDSWRDETLGRTLPVSTAQLYGLTVHVDDAARANLHLDGEVIETVSRNGPDETGRRSLTVLDCEIRSIVFDRLDPLANDPGGVRVSGSCAWRGDALEVNGAVSLALHGWSATGAQAFCFDVRDAGEGAFGIRLHTLAGAAFFFGDPSLAEEGDEATYAFARRGDGRRVVPFHDLKWRAGAGEHAPSHPLASITFLGTASFSAPTFLRPRATTLERDGFCVAGRAPDAEAGARVTLGDWSETIDHRGWFCFRAVPAGIYPLACDGRIGRRGPLVEVRADLANLVVDRPA